METVIRILLPVFGLIVCGFAACRAGVLPRGSVDALNRYAYYFALPPLLFMVTADAPLREFFNWPFIGAFLGGTAITVAAALAAGRLIFHRHGADLSLHVLATVFGNTAYMGIPVFLTAFGERGALPAVIATVASNVLVLGTVIAALEHHRTSGGRSAWRLGRAVLANPLLVASFLGLAASVAGASLPRAVEGLVRMLAQSAVPVALFTLGLSLARGLQTQAHSVAETVWLTFAKLAVHPAATWILARHWISDPLWMKSAVLMAAMPVGALVFVLSEFYGVQPGRASSSIVVSTALSAVTLGFLLLWLR